MRPKEQVEIMLEDMLNFARKMLVEHGDFHPFGVYLASTGDMVHTGVKMGGGDAAGRMRLLQLALQERKDCAIATA